MIPANDKDKSEDSPSGDVGESAGRDDQSTVQKEHGGPKGPEPTRYGDWERKGKCVDF